MLEYIRNELLGMTDKGEYVAFTSSLIPGCDNIIGIRQPVLKQYANRLIKRIRISGSCLVNRIFIRKKRCLEAT